MNRKKRRDRNKPPGNDDTLTSTQDEQRTPRNTEQSKDRRLPSLEILTLIFDGLIVLFTFVLTVTSIWQWRAMREALDQDAVRQRAC